MSQTQEANTQNVIDFPAPAPATSPAGTTMTPTKLVEKILAIRAKIDEIKKVQKAFLDPYNKAEEYLENQLMAVLNTAGAKSLRTDAGTFYKARKVSVKVARWSETLDWIKEHDAWELLEARVNKTAVEAMLAQTEESIPGVVIESIYALHVNKPRSAPGEDD
jgi:hypothetical protein